MTSPLPPPIAQLEQEIATEYSALPADRNAKWEWLLKMARTQPPQAAPLPPEQFLVKGCATRLYLVPRFDGLRLWLQVDVDRSGDSPLFSFGLALLAQRLYSGQLPAAILQSDPQFFKTTGIVDQLSPQRANGFASLLKQIRLYALVYSQQQS